MRFIDYMLEAGGGLSIPALHAPRDHFESAEEAVSASLDWERAVTGHIDDLMNLAITRRDHATQAMLQWFVTEQVEEVSTMEELPAGRPACRGDQPPPGGGPRRPHGRRRWRLGRLSAWSPAEPAGP